MNNSHHINKETFINRIYRHFKGNLYLVTGLSTDVETGLITVHYIALYGTCIQYSRTLYGQGGFLSRFDKKGLAIISRDENTTKQETCFKLVDGNYRCVVQRKLENGLIETDV